MKNIMLMVASLSDWHRKPDSTWSEILIFTLFMIVLSISILTTIFGVITHAIVNDHPIDLSWENLSCQTLEAIALLLTLLSQFMHFYFKAPTHKPQSPKGTPIILVPGYHMNRWSFLALHWYLYQRGFQNIWAINNHTLQDDVWKYVDALKLKIDQYLEATNQEQVILIGHSMGGLVCRHYIEKYGAEQVLCSISLATPYRGTQTYRLTLDKVGRQFQPGSEICSITQAPPIPHLIVRSTRDWVVIPFENTALDDANEMIVTDVGHLGVLSSVSVFQEINNLLTTLESREHPALTPASPSPITTHLMEEHVDHA